MTKKLSEPFREAVFAWRTMGAADEIAYFLRSDQTLSPGDRDWLALFIEGKIRLPRGKPPLWWFRHDNARLCIEVAAFEVAWRSEERRVGKECRL